MEELLDVANLPTRPYAETKHKDAITMQDGVFHTNRYVISSLSPVYTQIKSNN